MTMVFDSHRRIRSGEVSLTLTTKCNVAVLDVYSVEDGDRNADQCSDLSTHTFN